jgi:coproporphyrinogen III oxidase-like Fe-S oxidoreductase
MLIDLASRMMRSRMGKTRYLFTQAPPLEMDGAYGIYFNVPFCHTRCSYCPFYSEPFAKHSGILEAYLEAVRLEIQQARLRGKPQWLYVGGGTPNTLSTAQLGGLLDEVRKQVDPGLLGIELLPASLDETYLRGLRSLGFARISMGVQTFDEEIIRKTGRTYRTEDSLEHKIRLAQELGMWVNLDLMVGLAGQTPQQFQRDVEQIIRLAPNQVAIYPIVHVRGVQYGFTPSMDTIDQYQCIEGINEMMERNGYQRRTAWIFSQQGGDVYDTSGSELGTEYAGFGAGAYSVFGQWKTQNLPILPYLRSIQAGKRMAFVSQRERSNEDMRRMSKMIYRLRLDDTRGLSLMPRFALAVLAMTGYSRGDTLTAKGRLLSHEISRAVMESLPFPIQYPASVLNRSDYQTFCQAQT